MTVADGFETLANPTALSLIEIDPFEELEEEDDDELDEELDDEDEELEEEPKKPLFFPKVSTSQAFESATNFPPVVTFRFKITFRFEYSADLIELESVPIEFIFEPNFEAAAESSFQPMYC